MKKIISLVAILATITALASLPLAAWERRGATVEVTMADGKKVTGELLAVKSDALWVYDHDAGRGERLELRQVTRVKLFRKSKALRGLAIGLGAGLAMGLLFPHEDYNEVGFHVLLPLHTGFAGAIIGIFACLPRNFSLTGASLPAKQSTLERLGRYARESDAERSAAIQ